MHGTSGGCGGCGGEGGDMGSGGGEQKPHVARQTGRTLGPYVSSVQSDAISAHDASVPSRTKPVLDASTHGGSAGGTGGRGRGE
eukprot:2532768-Prymnesium_polylepis.1